MSSPELANISPRQSLLVIADHFLRHEIGLSEAVLLAKRRDGPGAFFAGEMSLQAAFDEQSPDKLQMAAAHYRTAVSKGRAPLQSYGLRSAFRLSQLELYQTLLSQDDMPTLTQVQQAYTAMVGVGYKAITTQRQENSPVRDDNAIELVGTNTEIAVGILAMREALKIDSGRASERPSTWLPLQSTFREDHGNNCLEASPNAWDLSVWTNLTDGSPETSYKVQIKTRKPETPSRFGETSDIVDLNVQPDLALARQEKSISRSIIMAAYYEATSPTRMDRIVDELDRRGGQLIDVLDQ